MISTEVERAKSYWHSDLPSEMSIPVARPRLPTTDEIAPYLRRIDASRWYSNGGPLVQEFEERLAQHFSDGSARVATVANATIGLAVALLAHDLPHESLCMDLGSAQKRAVWSGFSPAHPFRAGVTCLISFRGETGLAVVIATLPPPTASANPVGGQFAADRFGAGLLDRHHHRRTDPAG